MNNKEHSEFIETIPACVLGLAIIASEVFCLCVRRTSRYNIPNAVLAKQLDKSLRTIERIRARGLPDFKRISSVRKWIADPRKYEIQKLAEELGITFRKCKEYLKKGMPENDFTDSLAWVFVFESKETHKSLAEKFNVSEPQIRKLIKEGMPFNENFFAEDDARKWIQKRNEIKRKKMSIPQKCDELGISVYQFNEWIFKNPPLPSDNLEHAKIWIDYFTEHTGKKLVYKSREFTKKGELTAQDQVQKKLIDRIRNEYFSKIKN